MLRDENPDADSLCDDARIYCLGDANFNVTTLVNTGGDALECYVDSPYGVLVIYDATWSNLRSASSYAGEYTYTGRRLDGETGLYYYRHRVYHAQLGRFASRDPIGYRGGDSSLYRYVSGNPMCSTDSMGLGIWTCMQLRLTVAVLVRGHTRTAWWRFTQGTGEPIVLSNADMDEVIAEYDVREKIIQPLG